jgi:hypothetical protein
MFVSSGTVHAVQDIPYPTSGLLSIGCDAGNFLIIRPACWQHELQYTIRKKLRKRIVLPAYFPYIMHYNNIIIIIIIIIGKIILTCCAQNMSNTFFKTN